MAGVGAQAPPADAEQPACDEVKGKAAIGDGSLQDLSWPKFATCLVGALAALYIFLLGLDLMGDAFKCLGGRSAGSMFSGVDNPLAGLMVCILATVLLQSSSTNTSIVLGLVGADQITVRHVIPIVGTNIGTSVTNAIASNGQNRDRAALERVFAGATVHDMFNMLTMLTLLPLEVILYAITGEGGPLFWITTGSPKPSWEAVCQANDSSPRSRRSRVPWRTWFIYNDQYLIEALDLGEPSAVTPVAVNATTFTSVDCPNYFCVPSGVGKNWKKVNKAAYGQLESCEGCVLDLTDPCGGDSCFFGVSDFNQHHITEGRIIDEGLLQGAGDVAGGTIALLLSLILLCDSLLALVHLLQRLLSGRARQGFMRATKMNGYAAILVGTLITTLVQSSSVTTSVLTPLCGMGVLPLENVASYAWRKHRHHSHGPHRGPGGAEI